MWAPPTAGPTPHCLPGRRHWERRQSRWHLDAADGFAILVGVFVEDVPQRCFSPPWSVEEQPACFVMRDASGETIAWVYCEEAAAKLLSKDEFF